MKSFKILLVTIACFSTLLSTNTFAVEDNTPRLETNPPAAEGGLSMDQTSPILTPGAPAPTVTPNKNPSDGAMMPENAPSSAVKNPTPNAIAPGDEITKAPQPNATAPGNDITKAPTPNTNSSMDNSLAQPGDVSPSTTKEPTTPVITQ